MKRVALIAAVVELSAAAAGSPLESPTSAPVASVEARIALAPGTAPLVTYAGITRPTLALGRPLRFDGAA